MSDATLHVISLDRTPERFAQFLAQNPGIPVTRFPAIDGALLSDQDFFDAGLITPDNKYLPGARGLAMSHVTLWRACAADTTPYFIAEDDVILRADFWPRAQALLATVPGWDIVLWCHNLDWPVMLNPAPGTGHAVLQYDVTGQNMDPAAFCAANAPAILLPLISCAGTGCYAITPAGATRLLAACLPIGNTPARYAPRADEIAWHNTGIDVEMSRHYASLNAYLALPPLVLAPNDQAASTIRGHLAKMHDIVLEPFE